MRPSFAHFTRTQHARLCGLVTTIALAAAVLPGCASLPPPTGELSAAQQSVARAESADADQYAPDELGAARSKLGTAQSAMAEGEEDLARIAAESAASWADLATARSRAATTQADYDGRRQEIAGLRQRLQLGADDGMPAPLAWPEAVVPADADAMTALSQRLVALDADARLQGMAAYERLRARQSVDALPTVRNRDRPEATANAQRRVLTAETAAHSEAMRREVDRLDRERSELLVESSRQEAERARQEAERLRFEAQIQMEEAQRLRATAESEAAARAQAEEVILDVAGDQAARLTAARQREADLARQEAELTAGGALPPSKRDGRGEVFTLAGDAFGPGQASLTANAKASVAALGAYIAAAPTGRIRIQAHTDGQGEADANLKLSQRRADAVRDALSSAGVPRSRMQASGMGEASPIASDDSASGRARNRRVEIIVSAK